jgi:hypothetical protein
LTIEKRREVGWSAALIGDEYLAASDKKNPCHAAGGGSFELFSSISRDSCLKNDMGNPNCWFDFVMCFRNI